MKLFQRIATVAVASTTALSLAALPANADQRTFKDETRGSRSGDIRSATITHTKTKVVVRANVTKISLGDEYSLWLDTNTKDAGPEYRMGMYPDSDYLYLNAVETFKGKGGRSKCSLTSGWHAHAATSSKTSVIEFSVARRCIDNPNKIRVSLKANFEGRTPTDFLRPGENRFTGWIASS